MDSDDLMPKKFCPGCGENVDTFTVEREGESATGEAVEIESCIHCGMEVVQSQGNEITPLGTVLVADDSSLTRELLKDLIIEDRMASNVECCDHGASFITSFTKMAVMKKPASLVVLDVAMPVLNGVNAAISLRAIEKALDLKPTPIMFFTVQKCDENFKKVLAYCKPALYLNKGSSSSPDELSSRIDRVVTQLIKREQGIL